MLLCATNRPHAHGPSGREQVIGALGAQPVGRLERAIGMAHAQRRRDRRQLMDDHALPSLSLQFDFRVRTEDR
jgi:hypothetical protein